MPSALDLTIYLADLKYVQQGPQSEIMPYVVGCIGTYAKKQLGGRRSSRPRPEKARNHLPVRTPALVWAGFHQATKITCQAV